MSDKIITLVLWFFIGMTVGVLISYNITQMKYVHHSKLIDRGVAEYDSKTGEFKLK